VYWPRTSSLWTLDMGFIKGASAHPVFWVRILLGCLHFRWPAAGDGAALAAWYATRFLRRYLIGYVSWVMCRIMPVDVPIMYANNCQ
jgi:hypothetical protein